MLFLLLCGVGKQGDMPIDGLCTWLCRQLPMWLLWRCRLVWGGGVTSGTLLLLFLLRAVLCRSVPCFVPMGPGRPWQI